MVAVLHVPALADQYASIVQHLESLETEERVRFLPRLAERAPPVEISDLRPQPPPTVSAAPGAADHRQGSGKEDGDISADGCIDNNATLASLRHRNLRSFSLSLLSSNPACNADLYFANLTTLDVGNNELIDLPGLSTLGNLTALILTRNWFKDLPAEIGSLSKLRRIDASRNFLRPNAASLRFDDLRVLQQLRELDLSYNQKCGRPHHIELIQSEVPQLSNISATIWEQTCSNPNAYVGTSAAERDATLLRSQLEPWGTVQLRRRLVSDFGEEPTDPAVVDRAEVMERLLEKYRREGLLQLRDGEEEGSCTTCTDLNEGVARRRIVRVKGSPVRQDLLDGLLEELRSWRGDGTRGGCPNHRERPSIRATCYMIVRSPDAHDGKLEEGQVPPETSKLSRRAQRAAKKMERNRKLWDMALEAMRDVDPAFAARCTEMAVTFGFAGSPHIDKQNCGPFYGLALGNFTNGTGQVCVECSARVVAEVDTKNRLGRVDGRRPHWVTPYNKDEERFSLIYYETGGRFVPPGPAVFSIPS